jgi:thiamine transport system substrate-binding protein
MATDRFQSIIPETNWMYPAITPAAGLPKGFDGLIQPAKPLLLPAAEAQAIRDRAVAEWQAALSR